MSIVDRPANLRVPGPARAGAGSEQTRLAETPPAAPAAPAGPRQPSYAGTAHLSLRGELTKADRAWLGPELKELVASGAKTIEIDLSRVTHVDAAIARLLLRLDFWLGDAERTLLLVRPQTPVRHLLQWFGGGHLIVRRSRCADAGRAAARHRDSTEERRRRPR